MSCELFVYKEKIMSDTIILEYRSKSRNEIDKYHWAQKGLLKKQYGLIVRNKMRINGIKMALGSHKFKLLINCNRKRSLDYDNVVGGLKQLIDALVCERFIFDDDPESVEMHITQTKNKKEFIEITRILK